MSAFFLSSSSSSSSPIVSSRTTPALVLKNLHNSQSIRLLNSTGSIFNPTTHFKHRHPYVTLLSVNASSSATQSTTDGKTSRRRNKKPQPLLSEGRDEDDTLGRVCPGCGVFMQDDNPTLPGYYQKKKPEIEDEEFDLAEIEDELQDLEEDPDEEEEIELDDEFDEIDDEFDWDSDFEDDDEDDLKELDGFTAPGVGYGNITEKVLEKAKKVRVSKSERKKLVRESKLLEKEEVTVCARCHSLRNYGQVKNQTAENLIPDFDFDKLITTRLMKPTGNADSTVVVMVVDCVDFDGSFPKRAAKSLFEALEGRDGLPRTKKLPKLVLVATKVDLLPSQVSPTRLDRWVRHRARANGAPKLNGVYLVSSRKDLGVRNLLTFVKDSAGPRGHVWVIGAQNAGKSTLINAFAKKGGAKSTKLTEAAVPGTTLGILRIGGVLSAKAKMYDTPGLLQPYLMSMRLNREEQKMVEIRKELRPRTYRIKARQAIHVGGLVRLDLNQASVQTIYVTVWASPNVSLHLGKIENADEIWNKHAGVRLQPPIGVDRVSELGNWESREVKVSGISWDVNSVDLSFAGLGWFSVGLKGDATLTLWTFDGIEITTREPLVLDRAQFLERPGFLLPKAISEVIANESKTKSQNEDALV
ncbi:GTP-binding protein BRASSINAZOLE INSENSITIVE PALE GREEN 2, chloroplastic-like [Bidens hawaiensis]|uniref:GTP-binding protein BRASSINAZOLE INSENSITIVE PALE GREEN 2, chloroplastic-like n=1 Tax=Bidens hawaiensis TaxID=980011 RepID=UPI00404B0187